MSRQRGVAGRHPERRALRVVAVLAHPHELPQPAPQPQQLAQLILDRRDLGLCSRRDLLAVLDPLCGRGTTLNQALRYGYDAAGIDSNQRDFEAYSTFIRTWLKRKRIKHQISYDGPVRRDGRVIGRRLQLTLAASKEEHQAGARQSLDLVCADTTRAAEFFRPGSFDLVVADAPYGVQHGSRTTTGLARRPQDLLTGALPIWAGLLRPGGAVGIAWNTLVAPRAEAARILTRAGWSRSSTGRI